MGSSLIYTPASFAKTEELIELAKVAGEFGGMYISHIRGEATTLLESVVELIAIAREAKVPAEIYHLKAAGAGNWWQIDELIRTVEMARTEGLRITANMYLYDASSTGLDASLPVWLREGGRKAWITRLKDPEIRNAFAQHKHAVDEHITNTCGVLMSTPAKRRAVPCPPGHPETDIPRL